MHQVSSSAALIAVVSFTSALAAQVVAEIPAPTVATSFIDFDTMPLGPTGVGALNGAGVPAAASISTLTLTPSTAAPGVFNTNPGQQALALVAGAPEIIDGLGTAPFDAFNASIVFTGPCTEVGFGIGDWNGPMIIDFSLGGILQTSLTSSAYGAASLFKYYQMTGGAFDQIDIRASTTSGNWVIVDMEVQVLVGLFANFTATPTTGASPLAVQFTDLSFSSDPGGVLAWAWDFENDGTIDSMVQNPMHTYPTCGTFDVSLTVTDAAFPQSTALKTGFIVTDPVTASFTVAFLAPPGL